MLLLNFAVSRKNKRQERTKKTTQNLSKNDPYLKVDTTLILITQSGALSKESGLKSEHVPTLFL